MLVTQHESFIFLKAGKLRSYSVFNRHRYGFVSVMAKRRDFPEKSRNQHQPIFPIRFSNTILARSAVAVLGLGFIDAGYSGDWSRIGVISKETEDLLKVAAFLVLPLCIFLAISFTEDIND